MLKVFLVEDEVVMRNGIRNTIAWESEGFTFAGEASDGELAFPMIKKEQPDILITDIKMPFMDGLELSRLVRAEMPGTKILILSGYNDFEYAKTAISLGVTDYLLKPISAAKLLEALRRVRDQIEQEQESREADARYRQEYAELDRLKRTKLWVDLVTGQQSTMELLEQGRALGIDFTAAAYQVVLFKLVKRENAQDLSRELTELTEQINRGLENRPEILLFELVPEGWAFLVKGESEDALVQTREWLFSELRLWTSRVPQIDFFGGMGTVVQRLHAIRTSYREASRAFAARFFVELNQFVDGGAVMEGAHSPRDRGIDVSKLRSKKEERALLENFLRTGSGEEAEDFLETYYSAVSEENIQSLLYRQYLLMDIYFAVTDFVNELENGEEDAGLPDLNQLVLEAGNEQKFRETVEKLLVETIRRRDTSSRRRCHIQIEEARRYIQDHYQNDDMSLNSAAAQAGMTPSYFSTVFSSETGQTFVEYLTQVRIEKAKELLMCSNLRTAEVGYEVGYKDSHYFSYIFKKVTGYSPKDFKKR